MSEETLFDIAAFSADAATKSARKRAAGKPGISMADAPPAAARTPKLKRGPRTIAEALRVNELGADTAKTKRPEASEFEAPPAPAESEVATPKAKRAKKASPSEPASAPTPVIERSPVPSFETVAVDTSSAVPRARRGAKKAANAEAPPVESSAGAPAESAPRRATDDIHANLAAAAQSARQTAPMPATAVEPVIAAPAPSPVNPVASGPEGQPVAPPVEGQPPRERFSRRQRWKERRTREREQRGAKPGQGGQQAEGGGQQGQPQQQQHQQRHQQERHQHGTHQDRDRGDRNDRSNQDRDRGDRGNNQERDRGNNQDRDRNDRGGNQERDREPEKLQGPPEAAEGILELSPKGHGFLRVREKLYAQLPQDVFVHADLIRKFALREGMCLKGESRRNSRGLQMTEVETINGRKPEEIKDLPLFEELKATNPCKRYQLENKQDRMTTRVVDMMTPVGRGQRGLIVAPPRAGKTTLLQHIAESMIANYPNVHLMILLVDERPEEVTEFRRVLPQAEIFASSNDSDVKSHTRIAQFAIERAKRLVEMGDHVFILLDSITRLARAFNNANKNGATMSGGMGVGSMEIPRRLFAAARNTKTAGSLTILATALIETGSKMDDMIFAEFKGTGNMELVLDRKIAEQFIFPAVNIFKSGTRREELLLPAFQIEKIHMLRRGLAGHKPIEAIQRVLSLLERYPNNAQMLLELPSK